MRNQIANAFPDKVQNQCLEVQTSQEFHIYDSDEGKSKICENDEPIHFSVINPNRKSIYFLAVDKCLISDADGIKRCDCAVFDDSTFCFVEIKTLTTAIHNHRNKQRKEAREQLRVTIQLFKEQIDFDKYSIEALQCVGFEEPTPAFSARSENEKVKFMDELGVDLLEGNEKIFN